uniref:Uncharacterized protein n=1 Tax=Anguilla anguilla TaxID=7936 RepID=A0A0E9XJY7_ANGAN
MVVTHLFRVFRTTKLATLYGVLW